MCSCIWLAPPRLAFFLAICGVGPSINYYYLVLIKLFVVVVVVVVDTCHAKRVDRPE